MNASPDRQAVLLGLFITFAILILGGGILMIGTLKNTFTSKIGISAVFNEVSGLQPGDNIWFSGMKVGTVKELSFNGVSQVEVQLRVDETAVPFIHSDVLAKIGSDGLIGNRIVILYGGTPEAPPIKEGDVIGIGETVSTDELMKTLQDNNNNLLAITTDLKGITAGVAAGEGTLGKLLKDETLYASATDIASKLHTASTSAQNLTASLTDFARKLNQEGSLPNDLVTDTTTYASLQDAVANLHKASLRTAELVEGLKEQAEDPNTPLGTLMSDEEAGADLKKTLENLNESSKLLSEDLEALQHSFPLRRYFRKKAQAEEDAGSSAH